MAIRVMGGAANVSAIVPVDAVAAPPGPRLKLTCRNNAFGKKCGAAWESDVFTDCPKCGQRKFVHKVEPEVAA